MRFVWADCAALFPPLTPFYVQRNIQFLLCIESTSYLTFKLHTNYLKMFCTANSIIHTSLWYCIRVRVLGICMSISIDLIIGNEFGLYRIANVCWPRRRWIVKFEFWVNIIWNFERNNILEFAIHNLEIKHLLYQNRCARISEITMV